MCLQVVWLGRLMTESTWEPETSLPHTLVKGYEAGITQDTQKDTLTSGRQIVHTLSTTRVQKNVETNPKRVKTDPAENISDPSGCVYVHSHEYYSTNMYIHNKSLLFHTSHSVPLHCLKRRIR